MEYLNVFWTYIMNKTITIQIGNSDDKLTQSRWASFCHEMYNTIINYVTQIHFSGCSQGDANWQNACWVIVCNLTTEAFEEFKTEISAVGKRFEQQSVAFTVGETEFI